MDIGSPYVISYLGLGAGYQWTKLNNVGMAQVGGPFTFGTSTQSGAFAWQAILGASFPIPNVPGLSLTADYRFMDILGGAKYDGDVTEGAVMPRAALKLQNQFTPDVVIGVPYAFNAPPPPAPPAPAP